MQYFSERFVATVLVDAASLDFHAEFTDTTTEAATSAGCSRSGGFSLRMLGAFAAHGARMDEFWSCVRMFSRQTLARRRLMRYWM